MKPPGEPPARLVVALGTVLVGLVALLDYRTGVELLVFPLYFLPVLAVSLRLGRGPGLAAAALCAVAWEVSNLLAGMRDSRPGITAANFLVMSVAFAAVALLGTASRPTTRNCRTGTSRSRAPSSPGCGPTRPTSTTKTAATASSARTSAASAR